ncbi:hypothetical protein [Faecalicoccus pleomorphus]|uniref:DUF7657 domain-containing protein n=1 Tax=Faecalicoccus pleomorphus TaxID=1323 RepID=UPI0039F598F9
MLFLSKIKENEYTKKIIIAFICSMIFSVLFTSLYSVQSIKSLNIVALFYRNVVLFPITLFISFHFVFPVKKMYIWIYDHKWLIGFLFLAYVSLFRLHGDSITVYSNVVQPNHVNIYSTPMLGEFRPIRSDEYIVTTPSILASSLGSHPFSQYSDIIRGTETLTIINGVYLGLATLPLAPWELSYAILPVENAFSFCWYAPAVLSLLMSMELFYIITKNKFTSAVGGILVVLSSFYVWWGFSYYFFTGPATIFGVYKFIHADTKLEKVLYAFLIAFAFSGFIVNLYPAWQVPLGYVYLVIGIWVLYKNWDKIKGLKKFDYAVLIVCALVCLGLVITYFITIQDYVKVIGNTVYPGKRVDNGHYALDKIFYYGQSIFYPFKEIGNSSEASTFFSLFPIPTIISLYCFFKEKKKDVLLGSLLIIQLIFLLYVTVGLPGFIAKILLLSNSTAERTIDVLGYSEIIMIICLFTKNRNLIKLPFILGFLLSSFTAYMCVRVSAVHFSDYLTWYQREFIFVLIFILGLLFTVKLKLETDLFLKISLIVVTLVTSITVRPVMVGLSAIYSKPVAQKILNITRNDDKSKWITMGGTQIMGMAVSCGAPTINFVNTYPNLKLWYELDPNRKYENVYNRYAHITVHFTHSETSFSIVEINGNRIEDSMILHLSYKDIQKINIKYLLINGNENIDFENGYVLFKEIYSEDGARIYEIV